MRAVPIALLLLGVCSPARAGVYLLDEMLESSKFPYAAAVPDLIFTLRAAAVEPKGKLDPDSPRARYQRHVQRLEGLRRDGSLSTTEAVSLASAYLRLGDVKNAQRVLRAADQGHFLVQATLATASQMANELELAQRHLQRALDLWPGVFAPWSTNQLEAYRETEEYNMRLISSRLDESRRSLRPGAAPTLDPLFPGVRFVNDQGRFEAGTVSRKMMAKLPKNAGDVVLQLVLWQPFDQRLCWLLAELFNAHGQILPAARIIRSIVESGVTWPEFRERNKALQAARQVVETLDRPSKRYFLLGELMMLPRSFPGAPLAGDAAYYSSALTAPVIVGPEHDRIQDNPEPPPPPAPPESVGTLSPTSSLPFNLRHALVSFVFGVLVTALIGLQWREWRRRRPVNVNEQTSRNGAAPVPKSEGITQQTEGIMRQAPPS